MLTHRPTGLVVRSHDNRLQQINRKLALKKLTDILDFHLNGECSKKSIRIVKDQKSKKRKLKKQRTREEQLAKRVVLGPEEWS